MKRTPIYGKDRQYRVISGPNGTWIPQKFKARGDGDKLDTRESDPWRALNRPLPSFTEAMAYLPA